MKKTGTARFSQFTSSMYFLFGYAMFSLAYAYSKISLSSYYSILIDFLLKFLSNIFYQSLSITMANDDIKHCFPAVDLTTFNTFDKFWINICEF